MSIVAVCPHCEARYTLQPDLLGKPMRCPNPDCREVFVVRSADAPPPPPPPPDPAFTPEPVFIADTVYPVPVLPPAATVLPVPPPPFAANSIEFLEVEAAGPPPKPVPAEEDFVVPVFEGELVPPPPPPPTVIAATKPFLPTAVALPPAPPPKAKVPTAAPVAAPVEVDWAGAAPPVAAQVPPARRAAAAPEIFEAEVVEAAVVEDDDEPFRRRRNRKAFPYGILAGVLALIFLVVGGVVYRLVMFEIRTEQMLVKKGDEEFRTSNYPQAVQTFEELLAKFPDSEAKDRYQLFADLSALHILVGSAGVKENPAAARAKYAEFLEKYADSPLVKPDDEAGYGLDVFDAGRKLADGTVEFAKGKLEKYRGNRPAVVELTNAEAGVAEGKTLLPIVDKYRPKAKDNEIPALDTQKKALDDLTAQCLRERERLAVLAPFRRLADDPTDERIGLFLAAIRRANLESDAEAKVILDTSKFNLRKLIRTVVDVRPPVAAPADVAPALLFIAPPAGEKPLPVLPPNPDMPPDVFFASARGILYAIDLDSGTILWACRVGNEAGGAGNDDIPVRVAIGQAGTELALVPSDLGGKPGLTARVARTGEPYWHQPLEAPAAGRPVVVGTRVYVPLKDDAGTMVEIEFATGIRQAHVTVRQRLGPGAVRQPGTGRVFVPGDGRRVFAFDVDPFDADGNREPMRCAVVLNTDHADQSLRVPPVITGPPGEAPAPRFLVFAQADGTKGTRLRAFALPPVTKTKLEDVPPEITPASGGNLLLPGHVGFAPAADGERLAVVTDAGAFGVYGANLPGNQDPGLFAVPTTSPAADPGNPVPGQVVFADEEEYWILSRGNLIRFRLGLTPATGLLVAPVGAPRPLGVPVHRPQVNARRDAVMAVVRSDDSDGVKAVAFDPRDGRVKWQRKLGAVPPAAPVPMPDGGALLIEEDGGVYALPPKAAPPADGGPRVINPAWVAAAPSFATSAPPRVAATPDGAWVLTPERGEAGQAPIRVRRVAAGKLVTDAVAALPDRPAGDPLPLGKGVVIPLADGFVYKFDAAAGKLVLGPQWRGEKVPVDAACYLSAAGPDEFAGTDGGRRVTRRRWAGAGGTDWRPAGGPWELRERVAFAPVIIELGETTRRLFVADATGSVWLFDADSVGEPLRRWKGTADGPVPPGAPFGGFVVVPLPEGKVGVVYGVAGRQLVCVTAVDPAPAWVTKPDAAAADYIGWSAAPGKLIATDQSGKVTVFDPATGAATGNARPDLPDLFPRSKAVAFAGDLLLLPVWDGSAVFLTAR